MAFSPFQLMLKEAQKRRDLVKAFEARAIKAQPLQQLPNQSEKIYSGGPSQQAIAELMKNWVLNNMPEAKPLQPKWFGGTSEVTGAPFIHPITKQRGTGAHRMTGTGPAKGRSRKRKK